MNKPQLLTEFIDELSTFAHTAELTLEEIQKDLDGKKDRFGIFHQRMIAIRGTAQQLVLPHIAELAGLAEELALKAQNATHRAHVRKCVGSLWDALSTIRYLLAHPTEETTEEQQILTHRLEATLVALGGAAPKVSSDEIEKLLRSRH